MFLSSIKVRFYNISGLLRLLVLLATLCLASFVHADHKDVVLFDYPNKAGLLSGGVSDVPSISLPSVATASAQAAAVVVINNGNSGNRVNLVFIGDGYSSEEQGEFNQKVLALSEEIFNQAPFNEYKKFFNIHRINVNSTDSGATNYPEKGIERNTALGTHVHCQDIPEAICTNVAKAWELAGVAEKADQVIVLSNISTSSGSAYPFSSLVVQSAGHTQGADSLLHQLGHSFANLADEYNSGKWPEYTGFEPAEVNVSVLSAAAMQDQKVKWNSWLGIDSPGGTIDTYAGAMGHESGIYRPSSNSKMRDLEAPFNGPSLEAFIREVYRKVTLIEDATPLSDNLKGTDTLFVKHPMALHDAFRVQWYVGGAPVEGATQSSFRPNDFPLSNGKQEVRVVILDDTPLVKDEDFRNQYMKAERSWQVDILQIPPVITTPPQDVSHFVGDVATFGVTATGEDLRYQWYKNDAPIEGATTQTYKTPPLSGTDHEAGYKVRVMNVSGSVVSDEATLEIKNRAPIFPSIGDQITYRDTVHTVSLGASDPDGDPLEIIAELDADGQAAGAQVRILDGGIFELKTSPEYTGSFRVWVQVSDGLLHAEREFGVSVQNRLPVIQPISSISRRPGEGSFTVPVPVHDPDNDPLVLSAGITTSGARATVEISGLSLIITPESDYAGTFHVFVSASDGFGSVNRTFAVHLTNQPPKMDPISPFIRYMHPRDDNHVVTINAHDPDGDALTYSAEVLTSTAKLSLSFSENNLIITREEGYMGTAHINVMVSDGISQAERTFTLVVKNNAAVPGPVPDQTMHWRQGVLEVQIPVSDPDPQDKEFIVCEAFTVNQAPAVLLDMSDCRLGIRPPEEYQGEFSIMVTATDGIAGPMSTTFKVRVQNNSPVISSIPDQVIPRGVPNHEVQVSAHDPDGDPLTITAALAPEDSGASLGISVDGSTIELQTADFQQQARIVVTASDGNMSASTSFNLATNNFPPVLGTVPDQYLHWVKDREFTMVLDAEDPNDPFETLVFSAELLSDELPVSTIELDHNVLTIRLPERYPGSFPVKVSVTDGEYTDSSTFTVHSTNAAPELSEICDHAFTHVASPYDVTLDAHDPDEEELEFSYQIEHYARPWELSSSYHFQKPQDGWRFNATGHQEKYLKGIKPGTNQEQWFIVLPEGDLYEFGGTLASSIHIERLPAAYHTDPALLVNPPHPSGEPDIQVELHDETLRFIPGADYRGTVIVYPRVRDEQLFDEKSFLVTVYSHDLYLEPPGKLEFHWRDTGSIPIQSFGGVSGEIEYEVILADTSAAYNLYLQHQFGPHLLRGQYQSDNASGKGEKYFIGTQGTSDHYLYAILPTGEIYSCSGSISAGSLDQSTLLGSVSPAFYSFPEFLYAVPPPGAAAIDAQVADNELSVVPKAGFLGTVILSVQAKKGSATDQQDVPVHVYNSIPEPDQVAGSEFAGTPVFTESWRSGVLSYEFTHVEQDEADFGHIMTTALEGTLDSWLKSLFDEYDLRVSDVFHRFNEAGLREKYLEGVFEGEGSDFVILPGGRLFLWHGTVEESALIAYLPESFYVDPSGIGSLRSSSESYLPVGSQIISDGVKVMVETPEEFTGQVPIVLSVSDGISAGYGQFSVQKVNHPPSFASMQPLVFHVRSPPVTYQLLANDPDGDVLSYSVAASSNGGTALPVSVGLVGSQVVINHAPLFKGSFQLHAQVTDGTHVTQTNIPVQVFNSPPLVNPIPDQNFGWEQNEAHIPFVYSDPDSLDQESLAVLAFPGTVNDHAHALNQQYSFRQGAQGRVTNQLGFGEKYIQGTQGSESVELVILPGGGLYRIQGNSIQLPEISFLPLGYYENPSLLFNTKADSVLPPVQVVAQDGVIKISKGSKFTSTFPLTVLVHDGHDASFRTFTVTYSNHPPTLEPISNRVYHWRGQIPPINFVAVDPNGDPLLTSIQQIGGQPLGLQVQGSQVLVHPPENYVGQAWARLSVTDGEHTVHRDFGINLTNSSPVIQAPGYVQAGWKETVRRTINASDPDGDPLVWKAYATGSSASLVSVSIQNSVLEVVPITPFDGTLSVVVEVSDGPATASRTFGIQFQNRAPVFSAISNQSMHWRDRELHVPLAVSDPDGDTITLGAKFKSGMKVPLSITTTDNQVSLVFDEDSETGTFIVEVEASDGTHSVKREFSVMVTNTSPVLDPIPPQVLVEGEDVHEFHLSAHDPDNDPLEYSVVAAPDSEVGNYLHRKYKFSLLTAGHNHDRLGNAEKYVRGYRPGTSIMRTYVIYPDGRFYEWWGSLSSSLFEGYLPLTFYENPDLLFLERTVQHPAQFGSVHTTDEQVHVHVNREFQGDIWFRATASDSRDLDEKYFRLRVERSEVDLPDEQDSDQETNPDDSGGDFSGRKVTICHISPENPSGAATIRISPAQLESHLAHGDFIGECPGQPDDPGDGTRTCDEKQLFESPNYTLWNSFLGMINILELTNASGEDINVTVFFYSISGALTHKRTVRVPAVNQFDVIVNEFPGFVTDSYGIIKLEFEGSLDGRMMYYRPARNGSGYDYAYGMPLEDPQFGTTAVGFNTYQPSMKSDERNNIVANWLTIVNLANAEKEYTILSYNFGGELVTRREIRVPSFGRSDIDGGHDLAGADTVGYHKVIPRDITAEYISMVTRFGGNAPAGFAPSEYKFAFPLSARLGQSDPVFLPISRKFNETNWIEVVNILDTPAEATINYYANDGRVLESVDAVIPPNAQMHFNASGRLPSEGTGFAMIVPKLPRSIIAQSMGYLRNAASGSVTSVYGAQARRAVPCVQSGSYNLFLGMQNWLLIGNPTNDYVSAVLRLTGPDMLTEKQIVLAPKSSQFIPVHDSNQFSSSSDTYGLLAVYPDESSLRLFAQVMRVRFRADGSPDFSVPLPVR